MPVPKRKRKTQLTEEPVTDRQLQQERMLIAREHGGDNLVFLYRAFEEINTTIFQGRLKPALILLVPPRSKEPAWVDHENRIILVDPAVFKSEKAFWEVPTELLGQRFAWDVLLHACIHYSIGPVESESSHNTPEWIAQVNRIAPMIGLTDIDAQPSRVMRVKEHGKKSLVIRGSDGNVSHKAVSSFPWGVRFEQGLTDCYL